MSCFFWKLKAICVVYGEGAVMVHNSHTTRSIPKDGRPKGAQAQERNRAGVNGGIFCKYKLLI